jgi:hypothetical protein
MRRVSAGALLACLMLGGVGFAAVQAASLTGNINPECSLEVRSYRNQGDWEVAASGEVPAEAIELDSAFVQGTSDGGEGTQDDPFEVSWDGRVDFRFQTGTTVFEDNHWEIFATGIPVPILSGTDDNPGDRDEIGFVNIANQAQGMPRFVGLVHVSGRLVGNDGASVCEGEGWVQLVGDPTGTLPWLVMALLIAAGVVFLVATPYTVDWEEGMHTPWDHYAPGDSPRPNP